MFGVLRHGHDIYRVLSRLVHYIDSMYGAVVIFGVFSRWGLETLSRLADYLPLSPGI